MKPRSNLIFRSMNIFDNHHKKYDAWYDRNKFAYLSELEAIEKVLPKKGKGLEVGVGTGRFAEPLRIAFGVDPARNMLKIAKKRDINARSTKGEHLPFKSLAFDYVAIIITLSFVKNPPRVLKKNGKIIIGLIDKDGFLANFYKRKKGIFYRKAHFLSVKQIIKLLSAMGFGKISCYQAIFKLPGKIKSIEKPQKGFGRGGFVAVAAHKSPNADMV